MSVLAHIFDEVSQPHNWVAENHFHALSVAQNGDLNEMQSMFADGRYRPFVGTISAGANTNLLVLAAAAGGQLDVVKWIVQQSGHPLDLTAQHNRTLFFAVESGNLELVQWLVLHSGQKIDTLCDGESAEKIAVEAGFTEIEDFLDAVSKLRHVGVSIERIQGKPELADIAQFGKLPIEYVSWLSDDDIDALHDCMNKTTATTASLKH